MSGWRVRVNGQEVLYASAQIQGNLTFSPDATYDIGPAGATRPRHVYAGGNVVAEGSIAAAAGGTLGWASRSALSAPADGSVSITNSSTSNIVTITLSNWGTALSGEALSLSSGSTVSLGTAPCGLLYVTSTNRNASAIYSLMGSSGGSSLVVGGAPYSTSAADTNISVSYQTNHYQLRNGDTAAWAVRLVLVGV